MPALETLKDANDILKDETQSVIVSAPVNMFPPCTVSSPSSRLTVPEESCVSGEQPANSVAPSVLAVSRRLQPDDALCATAMMPKLYSAPIVRRSSTVFGVLGALA